MSDPKPPRYIQKRTDSVGLFWEDLVELREKKEKVLCVPPERTWEEPGYLPNLEEAKNAEYNLYTDEELMLAVGNEAMYFDIECYVNYFLIMFEGKKSGKRLIFEMYECDVWGMIEIDYKKLMWVVLNFQLIGFNSIGYDIPIMTLALNGANNVALKHATWEIIVAGIRGSDMLKLKRIKQLQINHYDLIEVAPLRGSLKAYGGRLHLPRMQDLPFEPDTILSPEQILITRWYCKNDLQGTKYLDDALEEQIHLRERMSARYAIDLRSKSDAQIAEAVIISQVNQLKGGRVRAPLIPPGTVYRYQKPPFVQFRSELLKWVLARVENTDFCVSEHGGIELPKELKDLKIEIGRCVYRMGIGGLHSTEKSCYHRANESVSIKDRDVTGYYPEIIIKTNLYPAHIGPVFTNIYKGIQNERVTAKKAKDKITADSLKITVNGGFGKFGSKYSAMYAPNLLIQTTIGGQLILFMLIEAYELAGLEVISANTDGVTVKVRKDQEVAYEAIIKEWERATGFETEEAIYTALYSRDVNNYIAVKPDGTTKTKGAYSDPWSDPKLALFRMHKNPEAQICTIACQQYLINGTRLHSTIEACTDIRQFVSVRKVTGGAVKNGNYLGKMIRWYYAQDEKGHIISAEKGSRVPKSEGARPLMLLPETLPNDIDYNRYVNDAIKMLKNLGVDY